MVLPALRLVPLPMVTKMGTTVKRVLMSQPLWSAVPCYNGTQPDVSMGDIPMVKMMLYVFVFMGEHDMPVYVFWGILFSDTSIMVMGCYESTWSEDPQIVVNSYQFHITNHPTPCDWDLF